MKYLSAKGSFRLLLVLLLLAATLLSTACGNDGSGAVTTEGNFSTSGATGEPEDLSQPKFYKTVFNSDTTHIMQCASPYHTTNQDTPLTKKMVEAAVTEALDAGADCYVITPGHCWVPWWPSQYLNDHATWFFDEFKGTRATNPFWVYVHVKGNDFIQQQIDVCRKRGAGAFISFRMNDAHMIGKNTPETGDIAFSAEIFVEHPEYKIGAMSDGANEQVLDFRHEAVREEKLKLIAELIANYELDGFELDFCRRFTFFNIDKTTEEERVRIMTDFVAEVRKMLDAATEKDGRYRHLSVRVPIYPDQYGRMGIDLKKFEEAGVTMFNFTSSYFMDQNFNLAALKAELSEALVYCELNFITAYTEDSEGLRVHRRAQPEQYYTTALQAYDQGADGLSFFNFQYYRGDRQGEGDKPLTEPPWEVIANVESIEFLKQQGQYYYFGKTWKDPITTTWRLPRQLIPSIPTNFDMYLVAPEGGWSTDGVFRLQSEALMGNRVIAVKFNGTVLSSIPYAGEAYDHPYTQMLGVAANYLCYSVPKELLKEGKNTVQVTLTSGSVITLCFVDLTVQ
ncbi:MAG: hypothetical protein E7620_04750 [Ruminococcaceae bacterium]|nr:hypothetical protein [Oscillospiraceae bacterium]